MSQDLIVLKEEATNMIAAGTMAQNPAAVYLASLRPTGRRTMKQALGVMAGLLSNGKADLWNFPWHNLCYQHTAALATALEEKYRPATANKMLAALRRVLKEAWRLGLMAAEDYHRAVDLPTIHGETLLRGRAPGAEEVNLLLKACLQDTSIMGARDAALLAILYGAGLRRSEAVKLDFDNYDPQTRALTLLSGKGAKDRLTYLGKRPAAVVTKWLELRGLNSGPLFYPISKGGNQQKRRMTDQAVLWILQKRAREMGLKPFSPHDLRRTFISNLLDAEADIATVQKLAGHANIETTARYDRRGEAAKKRTADMIEFPALASE